MMFVVILFSNFETQFPSPSLLMSVSRVYADVISKMPEGYADYDTVEIDWQYVFFSSF